MPEYEHIGHDTDYPARLQSTSLLPPIILISSTLKETLAQQNERIAVDDGVYLDAVGALGLQKIVTICLAEQTVVEVEDDTRVTFDWSDEDLPAESRVFVDPYAPRTTLWERRNADRDLNRRFWLGVSVGAALAYGRGRAIQNEYTVRKRKSEKDPEVFLAGSMVAGIFAGIVTLNVLYGFAAWVAVDLPERTFINNQQLRFLRMRTAADYALQKYQAEAVLLARRYPALRRVAIS